MLNTHARLSDQEALLAAIIGSITDEAREELREVLFGLATGKVVTVSVGRGGSSRLPDAEWEQGWIGDVPVEQLKVHRIPPDLAALRLILEFSFGRPGQREIGRRDPSIHVHTTVPMSWELSETAEGEPVPPALVDGLGGITADDLEPITEALSETMAMPDVADLFRRALSPEEVEQPNLLEGF